MGVEGGEVVTVATNKLERALQQRERAITRMYYDRARSKDPEYRKMLKQQMDRIGDECKDLRRKIIVRRGLLKRT